METKPTKRAYNSTRRRAQATQTRAQILAAGRELFFARGYANTTIDAIAAASGVSVESIYAIFGNKMAILSKLIEVSLTGDEEPIPLLQREYILSAREAVDQIELINAFAVNISNIMTRMAPIFALLRATQKTDPEIAAMLERMLKDRLKGMGFFIQHLARIGPLRPTLTAELAAETAWALSSAEVYQLMTVDLAWPPQQYVAWLSGLLVRSLLPEPDLRAKPSPGG